MPRSFLKRRAALALLVAAMAAPALFGSAAHAQSLNFGIMFGDERSDFRFGSDFTVCKTQYQIRQAFAQRGYEDVFLNVLNEPRVQVRATQGGTVYLIEYDYCRDQIVDKKALRAAR